MPVTMQIGSIGSFDESEEPFESYSKRIDLYFMANDIKDNKKVAAFLTLAGPKIYALTTSLLSPTDPGASTYDDIINALKAHFKPATVLIFERYKFYSRNQKSGESISDFVAELKHLAHTCNFDASLPDMLRDKFVMGIASEATQHALLSEKNLTFDRALEMATAREAATRDVQAMGGASNMIARVKEDYDNSSRSTNFVKSKSNFKSSRTNDSKPEKPCSGCGAKHWKADCPFKDAECFLCKKKGHIRKVCFKNNPKKKSYKDSRPNATNTVYVGSRSNQDTRFDDPYQDYVLYSSNRNISDKNEVNSLPENDRIKPFLIPIKLNGKSVNMELDTGAACSLISKYTYEELWPSSNKKPHLEPSSLNLKVYGGGDLEIAGEISVKAELPIENKSCNAKIVVIDGSGPSLLGRDLISKLKLSKFGHLGINNVSTKSVLLEEFPDLFTPGLGCLKGVKATIEVDPTIPPKYCRARAVPYTMKEKVTAELDRLVSEGIISPITNSPWAAAIVPVMKPDNTVRICGDYKLTVNKAARLDTYPIPNLQDLFSNMAGAKIFSKLDMSQAYAQLCLEEESKKFTVINTHKGLFQYNRLCFGVSSAPGIFQRTMEQLLQGIPGCICFLDDILIIGSDNQEHEKRLRLVLNTLESAGLRLKPEKCSISVSQVTYLGFRIDAEGIHPTTEKVQAIDKAPAPTNVTQLRAYLGLLNFYCRFLPKASTMLEPLNRLLRSHVKWSWGKTEQDAFSASKKALLDSPALVHFDPKLPLVMVADSSSYGIGAVLCHLIEGIERPICFASRSLTTTERNYAQIEKEALALVFGLRKFHYYLWGQPKFTMITDHKPLLGLFSASKPISAQSSSRIQRWALFLQAYSFDLYHRSGALLGTADALSRLPLKCSTDATPVPAEWKSLVCFLDNSPVTSIDIRNQSRIDPIISKVIKFTENGWPSHTLAEPDLAPYSRKREELSLQYGCLLWGARIIIPPKLRNSIIEELHSGHAGSTRMKELARSYLWWPNLDKDLEEVSHSCPSCLALRSTPGKAELHPWEWPTQPWHRIHVDYAGPVNSNYFLIIVDAHSKWVEVYPTKGPTTKDTVQCLNHTFATFGLPVSIVSDNGPCFTSSDFRDFCQNRGIKHITTAVYKPSTNGLAERMVQSFKRSLRSSTTDVKLTVDKFVFNYRMTPHSTTGVSPAELMFGRKLRSRLDLLWPTEQVARRVAEKQATQKENYCKYPRKVSFTPTAPILVRNYSSGAKWIPATIREQTGPLSYKCELPTGGLIKRHQDQIISGSPSPHKDPIMVQPPLRESSEIPDPEVVEAPRVISQNKPPGVSTASPRRSSRVRKPVDRLDL